MLLQTHPAAAHRPHTCPPQLSDRMWVRSSGHGLLLLDGIDIIVVVRLLPGVPGVRAQVTRCIDVSEPVRPEEPPLEHERLLRKDPGKRG